MPIILTGEVERLNATCWDQVKPNHKNRYKLVNGFKTVLDLGCGVGYGSWHIAQDPATEHVDSYDNSPEAIEQARKYFSHDKVTYAVADVCKPFTSSKLYDCVVAYEIVEHVKDPLQLLQNIYDSLHEGGTLFISTPNGDLLKLGINYKNDYHLFHWTTDEFGEAVTNAGFRIVRWYDQIDQYLLSGTGNGLSNIFEAIKCSK